MYAFSFELLCLVSVMYVSARCCWRQIKRRRRSWTEIVSQLSANDWGLDDIAHGYPFKCELCATTEDIWTRIEGCRGLIAMYRNAGVLVELADYAANHGEGIDPALISNLHTEAFQIRISVFMALVRHAFSSSPEGRSLCAFRAAELYSRMLATLTGCLQEHATRFFPSYLDAVA